MKSMETLHIAISDRLCLVATAPTLKQWVPTCASMGHRFDRARHRLDGLRHDQLAGKVCVVSLQEHTPKAPDPSPDLLHWIASLKKQTDVRILVVSSSLDPKVRQSIMRAGANDILFAPFADEELAWRINRFNHLNGSNLNLAGWSINTDTGEAFNASLQLATRLTGAERQILNTLWQAAGAVVLRSELAQSMGHPNSEGRSLNTLVLRLRKKLEKNPDAPTVFITVPKRGYRLGVFS
jgi:DNA-binding response OmpR family regulator